MWWLGWCCEVEMGLRMQMDSSARVAANSLLTEDMFTDLINYDRKKEHLIWKEKNTGDHKNLDDSQTQL